jgi:hypothetical protein
MSLLDLEPHKVSRDLRGYSVLFYGEVKSGKTTNASKFPNALLLAFEKGYSALAGVYAKPMNNWTDFLKTLRELKEPEVQEKFETIVIDTADIAYEYVEQYICNVEGVDTIGAIPFGQGFTKAGREFDSKLRQIVQMGYGLVLISHSQDKVFQNEDGTEYNKIVPTLSNKARLIVSRLCDIIGYSRQIETPNGLETYLFMRGTPRFEAGSRFPYTSDRIPFSYENLVADIGQAIDKQAEADGGQFVTDERENLHKKYATDLDFDALMSEFETLTSWMVETNAPHFAPRITESVERHLGQGRKVADCSRAQVMLLDIIVTELEDLKESYKPEAEPVAK